MLKCGLTVEFSSHSQRRIELRGVLSQPQPPVEGLIGNKI